MLLASKNATIFTTKTIELDVLLSIIAILDTQESQSHQQRIWDSAFMKPYCLSVTVNV